MMIQEPEKIKVKSKRPEGIFGSENFINLVVKEDKWSQYLIILSKTKKATEYQARQVALLAGWSPGMK